MEELIENLNNLNLEEANLDMGEVYLNVRDESENEELRAVENDEVDLELDDDGDDDGEYYRHIAADVRNNNITYLNLEDISNEIWYSRILALMLDNTSVKEIRIVCGLGDIDLANLTRDFFMNNTGVKKILIVIHNSPQLGVFLDGLTQNENIDEVDIVFGNRLTIDMTRDISNVIIGNRHIKDLKIFCGSIDEASAQIYSHAFARNSTIEKLTMGGRSLAISRGFYKFLKTNKTLKSFSIRVEGDSKLRTLCDSLPTSTNLTELILLGKYTDMIKLDKVLRNSNITSLDVTVQYIKSLEEITRLLQDINLINSLNIRFGPKFPENGDIGSLSNLLFEGSSLRSLSLVDGPLEFKNFATALKANHSLKNMTLSNINLSASNIRLLYDSMKTNKGLKFITINIRRNSVLLYSNYYTELNKAYNSLEIAGAEIVINNEEIRKYLSNLFTSFSVSNNMPGKIMTKKIPIELQYMIVRNYVGELLRSFD